MTFLGLGLALRRETGDDLTLEADEATLACLKAIGRRHGSAKGFNGRRTVARESAVT
jgi:hypothetical protein